MWVGRTEGWLAQPGGANAPPRLVSVLEPSDLAQDGLRAAHVVRAGELSRARHGVIPVRVRERDTRGGHTAKQIHSRSHFRSFPWSGHVAPSASVHGEAQGATRAVPTVEERPMGWKGHHRSDDAGESRLEMQQVLLPSSAERTEEPRSEVCRRHGADTAPIRHCPSSNS